MTADELKSEVAKAAIDYVVPGAILGVGTGSTVNHFIDHVAKQKIALVGAVSSSEVSTARMKALGIKIFDLSEVVKQGLEIPVYVDGADEIDPDLAMIKGGGAALTREKIVADVATSFVCIVDQSKLVKVLGSFALPVEVIPMAAEQISRQLTAIGARPVLRAGVVTDNGNLIVDAHDLSIDDPAAMEIQINQWPGVVTVGLFARRRADVCLVASPDGVQTITA